MDLYRGSDLFKSNASELDELMSRAPSGSSIAALPSSTSHSASNSSSSVASPSGRTVPLAEVSVVKSEAPRQQGSNTRTDGGMNGYEDLSDSASCLASGSATYVTPWYYSLWILLCEQTCGS